MKSKLRLDCKCKINIFKLKECRLKKNLLLFLLYCITVCVCARAMSLFFLASEFKRHLGSQTHSLAFGFWPKSTSIVWHAAKWLCVYVPSGPQNNFIAHNLQNRFMFGYKSNSETEKRRFGLWLPKPPERDFWFDVSDDSNINILNERVSSII